MFDWWTQDVDHLIAKGKYAKAEKQLRAMLVERPRDLHLRQKLADVLALAGERGRAEKILEQLVEELAGDGFIAKAIAVVKKIQRLSPERQDLDARLADLAFERLQEDGSLVPPPEAFPHAPSPVETNVPADSKELQETLQAFKRSLLFRDLPAAELGALIGGLLLRTYDPGQIVIAEGEPGSSLLLLASGRVRVYVRNEFGHQVQVRVLEAGEFFGEISILTGHARTATVTAAEPCEILELDQETLEELSRDHPRISEVIRQVCERRAASPEELQARHEIELPL